MTSPSESSRLLDGLSSLQEEKMPSNQRRWFGLVPLVLGSTVLVVVASRNYNGDTKSTTFDDPISFDAIYHKWEESIYNMEANLVSIEKSARHSANVGAVDDHSSENSELIYLNHTRAFDLLSSTEPSLVQDFFYYQQGWEAQINQAYCGVASATAALNSLRGKINLPQDPIYDPFPWATQMTLIKDQCVRDNIYDIDKMENQFWGLGLEMATALLNCNLEKEGYMATAHPVDPTIVGEKEIRTTFMEALKDENARILMNYDRGGISQGPMGHGHFSPIAAYNREMDAFLVLDVAKYKYPPVWVPTSKLMGGMGSVDHCAYFTYLDHPIDLSTMIDRSEIFKQIGCETQYRGYIIVSEKTTSQ